MQLREDGSHPANGAAGTSEGLAAWALGKTGHSRRSGSGLREVLRLHRKR